MSSYADRHYMCKCSHSKADHYFGKGKPGRTGGCSAKGCGCVGFEETKEDIK